MLRKGSKYYLQFERRATRGTGRMKDKKLRKLNRRDLLELLVRQEEQNEALREKVLSLEEQLNDRKIDVENTGSMAEASMALNEVFASTDRAASQYLENIRRCSEQQESIYNRIVGEAEQKAKEILENAETERQKKIKDAEEYWISLSERLETFYREHAGLRELLSVNTRLK